MTLEVYVPESRLDFPSTAVSKKSLHTDSASTLGLNYSEFPNSSILLQLAASKDVAMTLSEQLRAAQHRQHRRLGQLCRSAHAEIRAMADKALEEIASEPRYSAMKEYGHREESVNHLWKLTPWMFKDGG